MSLASRYPAPAARRTSHPGWIDRHGRLVYGLIGLVGVLALWEVGGRLGFVSELFFSRPTAIVEAGIREVQLPRFWRDLGASTTAFVVGYLLATITAVPLGLLAGWYKRLNYVLDPWLNFLNSLPRIALIPVILIAVGLGIWSKIVVVFLGAFFAIIIPTIQGVRTVDRRYLDVGTSFGASRRRTFLTIVAPSTVPFITTGLRLGIARALIGVVTAELYAATIGIGVMIKLASDALQSDRLLFGVLIFTFAGLVLVEGLRRVEKYFQRWRPMKGTAT